MTRPVRSAAKHVRGKPAPPNGRWAILPVVSWRLKTAPQCSSWMISRGALSQRISIASWSPM